MKKKQTKHFVPHIEEFINGGVPACQGFNFGGNRDLPASVDAGEVAKTRREVTCGNCRRTRVLRKLK